VGIAVGARITCDIAGVIYVRLTAAVSGMATPPAPSRLPLNALSVVVEKGFTYPEEEEEVDPTPEDSSP